MTALGDACIKLNEKLSRKQFMAEAVGSFAPALFLLSDGEPTDNWERGLAKLKENKWYQKAIKAAVAIGNDADINVLEAFTGNIESLLTVHTPAALAKMITFITVTASEIGSKSSSVGLGVGNSSTDAIQTKQDDFNDALAAMAPAIVSNDSDDDEWD